MKVRAFSGSTAFYAFNTQIFFNEAVTGAVYLTAPYSAHPGQSTFNANDGIYAQSRGTTLITPTSDGSGGYTGGLTVGLAGVSGGTGTGDTAVDSSLTRARWARTSSGRRVLRLRLDVNEAVAADARILRGGRRLARKVTSGRLAAGNRLLKVPVSDRVVGGRARLRLTLTDAAGNVKTIRRKVRIPRRSLG